MKYCTIISDSPLLSEVFCRHAAHEKAFLAQMCCYDIQRSVERAAQHLGYSPDHFFWHQAAQNPPRIGLVCPDEMADRLRDELRDQYIFELDCI